MNTEQKTTLQILENVLSRAVPIKCGVVQIDGMTLSGIDGERTLKVFAEGIKQDVSERGCEGARYLYRQVMKEPGRLAKALSTSQRFARELDAEDISRK